MKVSRTPETKVTDTGGGTKLAKKPKIDQTPLKHIMSGSVTEPEIHTMGSARTSNS